MSPTESKPAVTGLPDGVKFVKIAKAEKDDYEIIGGVIFQGPRPLAASGVIVEPADGYVFEKGRFDMISYRETFIATKKIEPTTIKKTIEFKVETQHDLDVVNRELDALKQLPGFVSVE